MSRRLLFLAVPFVAVATLAALRPAPAVPPTPPSLRAAVETVTITFQCEGRRGVDPWVVRVREGDEIVWRLSEDSDVSEFTIEKKRLTQRWLFREMRPPVGAPGRPTVGADMRPGARGTHPYVIKSRCPGPGNSSRPAEIDPDIIVDVM